MSKSTKHRVKRKRDNTKSRRKASANVAAAVTTSAATRLNGDDFAQQAVGNIPTKVSTRQSQDDLKQQDTKATTKGENNSEEQHQISSAAEKDGLNIAAILLPVVIGLGTTAVGFLYETHLYLSILISYFSFLALVCLTHILLRHKLLREEKHRKPLRIFSFAVVIIGALACLVLMWVNPPRRNEQQNTASNLNKQVDAADNSSNASEVFLIRQLNSIMLPVYPQPLLYVYSYSPYVTGLPSERVIAPIGLAINLEVVNNRPTATKIQSYTVELETGTDEWTRINRLPANKPHDIYFADEGGFKSCVKFEFKPNIFDVVALQKTLLPGDSLDGWMFFEWPAELHTNNKLRNVRIRVQNSQGETEEAIFNILSDDSNNNERGVSLINEGSFGAKELKAKKEDLSGLPIRPFESE